MQPRSTPESRWAQGIEPCRTPTKGPTFALLFLSFERALRPASRMARRAGWPHRTGSIPAARSAPVADGSASSRRGVARSIVAAKFLDACSGQAEFTADRTCTMHSHPPIGPAGESNPGMRRQARAEVGHPCVLVRCFRYRPLHLFFFACSAQVFAFVHSAVQRPTAPQPLRIARRAQ